VRIAYTIENGKIEVRDSHFGDNGKEYLRIFNLCDPTISIFHVKGHIENKSYSVFDAASEQGILLSVQVMPENNRFEFESFNNFSVSYAPVIKSIQLILPDTGFKYSYDAGVINRFDIYIPAGKLKQLIPEKLLIQLYKDKIVNLSSLADDYPKTNNSLNKLLKRLEKPKSKSLCNHIESFIQSVTI
jgi:hypothetical protein